MIQAFYMDRCHFCPSPESSKVICRSIQRKVKDFFSFFTCSMSATTSIWPYSMKISDTRSLIIMGFSAGSMGYSLYQSGDIIAQLRAELLDVVDLGAMGTSSAYTRF